MCLKFLSAVGLYLESLSEARAAATPVFRLIDEVNVTQINEPDLWVEEDKFDMKSTINGDIEFNHVNFSYPSRNEVSVLRNLSLIARAGQTTALVGLSGCGKLFCISENTTFLLIHREKYVHGPSSSTV